MNKTQLQQFVISLLDDNQMGDTLFDTFLDIAQSNRENARPWMILRTVDSTQTANTSDTYLTAKTLPADFKKTYTRFSVVLTDSNGNVISKLREIPISKRNEYKSDSSKFYINYVTRQFFLCGNQSQSSTINFHYIYKSTKISAADTNTWVFDSYDDTYVKMLGFDIAVMHKLGVDYDQINAVQGNNNALQASIIFNQMAEWDSELVQQAQEGVDYGGSGSSGFTENGGNVSQLM